MQAMRSQDVDLVERYSSKPSPFVKSAAVEHAAVGIQDSAVPHLSSGMLTFKADGSRHISTRAKLVSCAAVKKLD